MSRDQLMERLHSDGIDTRTFFCPMNQQPCLQVLPGYRPIPCPVADELWETGLYLPSTQTLTDQTIEAIAAAVKRPRDESLT